MKVDFLSGLMRPGPPRSEPIPSALSGLLESASPADSRVRTTVGKKRISITGDTHRLPLGQLSALTSLKSRDPGVFSHQRSAEILQHLIATQVSLLAPDAQLSTLLLLQEALKQLRVIESERSMRVDDISFFSEFS